MSGPRNRGTTRNAVQTADAEIDLARGAWRLGDLVTVMRHLESALAVLERAGLDHRMGETYKLLAMAFISRDQASLALAAAKRALGYPDIAARDRMYLYGTIAMALHQLVDLQTGGRVLLEQAWPEALKAGDPKTIVDCASRCAGLLLDCANWASGIVDLNLVGIEGTAPESAAAYLERARQFIAICEPHADDLEAPDASWLLCQKASVVAALQGFDAAWPVFLEARARAAGWPRQEMMTEKIIGTQARIAGRLELALEQLLRARAMPGARNEPARRMIAWELSHVYAALDMPARAIVEVRAFEVLQARKSKLSIEWITDATQRRRFGGQVDPRVARASLAVAPPPAAIVRAKAYIESHLHDPLLRIAEVASASNVSPRTLQSLFSAHLGIAVSKFIRERRLQHADGELRSGLRRVAEVAERAGYSSPANFSRDYRLRFGRPPSSTHRLVHGLARRPSA